MGLRMARQSPSTIKPSQILQARNSCSQSQQNQPRKEAMLTARSPRVMTKMIARRLRASPKFWHFIIWLPPLRIDPGYPGNVLGASDLGAEASTRSKLLPGITVSFLVEEILVVSDWISGRPKTLFIAADVYQPDLTPKHVATVPCLTPSLVHDE